ncbi:MAG: transposase, partial [Bacteroidetes bacterium]
KQKVSGQFRSESGARSFAIIRSVIDTIIKRNKNIFDCLAITANLVPE